MRKYCNRDAFSCLQSACLMTTRHLVNLDNNSGDAKIFVEVTGKSYVGLQKQVKSVLVLDYHVDYVRAVMFPLITLDEVDYE